MLPADLIAEIKRLEIRSRRRVDTDLIGGYQSAFRGSGLTYQDLRDYTPGDEIRHIHWKATARSGKTFVKSYTEDRELRVMLLVDVSRSLAFKDRRERAAFFSAAVAMLALANQDSVGLITFGSQVQKTFPPKRGRHHVQAIIAEILATPADAAASNLASALEYTEKLVRRSSVIFIVSDFLCPPFEQQLKRLARRHDVIGALIGGHDDLKLPPGVLLELRDAEGAGKILIDSRRAGRVLAKEDDRRLALRNLMTSSGADLIELETTSLRPLRNLMSERAKRFR